MASSRPTTRETAENWRASQARIVHGYVTTALDFVGEERFSYDERSQAELHDALDNLIRAMLRARVVDRAAASNVVVGPWGSGGGRPRRQS